MQTALPGRASPDPPDTSSLATDVARVIEAVELTGELPDDAWPRVLKNLDTLPDVDVRNLLQALCIALNRYRRASRA